MSSKAAPVGALAVGLLLLMACSGVGNTGEGSVPTWDGFLTPVAEAQQRGIKPYWLGTQFEAHDYWLGTQFEPRDFELELDPFVQLFEPKNGHPGLSMSYYDSSGLSLNVNSFPTDGEGWRTVRDRAAAAAGSAPGRIRQTTVGSWPAEVIAVPVGDRPVNSLSYFLQIGDTVVVAVASSGSTGNPITDVNPLIDPNVLAPILEQLRPYPE